MPPSSPNRHFGSDLPPGEELFITVGGTLSIRDIQQMMKGTERLYVFGSILYSDAKDIRHRTNWCGYVIPEGRSFGKCQYDNDMN